MKVFRQGDVLIFEPKSAIKKGAEIPRDGGSIVLAYGEVTGHKHQIASKDAVFFESQEQQDAALALGTRILEARKPVMLRHEEHGEIEIPEGTWLVRIQREYSPQALRNVAD